MKIQLYLLSLILLIHSGESTQPYFPPQIVFGINNGESIFAIDQINQQAYQTFLYSEVNETIYASRRIPYAIPDSPQTKYYVQLSNSLKTNTCEYGTFWQYGVNNFNRFPFHWLNGSVFEIQNYIKFDYQMIYSTKSSTDEDYWYSNEKCSIAKRETYPCQEIYFQKNTDIPLRFTEVIRSGWDYERITTTYQFMSKGQPIDQFIDTIPKNWSVVCTDINLGVRYYPTFVTINQQQSVGIQVSLSTPPHRINGNDTATIQWKEVGCTDCFTWTPNQLSFNIANFNKNQTLTVTRVKNGPQTKLFPIFFGGGLDLVKPDTYYIFIEPSTNDEQK